MHPHKCPDFDHGEVKPGDPMMEFCQCEPITMEQRIAAIANPGGFDGPTGAE